MKRKAQIGEQSTVIWFIFLLLIIVVALGVGTYMFFGSGFDARKIDADLLNYKIKKCLTEKNIQLDKEIFKQEFYEKCQINEETIKEYFYIHIEVNNELIFEEGKGDTTQCELQEKNENYPRCTDSTIQEKNIFIQTGSNQQGRKNLV